MAPATTTSTRSLRRRLLGGECVRSHLNLYSLSLVCLFLVCLAACLMGQWKSIGIWGGCCCSCQISKIFL